MAAIPVPFPECAGGHGKVAHFHLAITPCSLWRAARVFGPDVPLPWKTGSNKQWKNIGSSFSVRRPGDSPWNQHTKDSPKCDPLQVVWCNSKISTIPFPTPRLSGNSCTQRKEKIPWLCRTSQPLIYLQAEWYIQVNVAGAFQNWSNKLFYWYIFHIHGGFPMT